MNFTKLLVAILRGRGTFKVIVRISPLILLILSACGPAALPAASMEDPATPPVESTVTPTSTPEKGEEQIYPYYLPLATKPDIALQTIDDVTTEIDWVYVDESRVALQYTISGLDWPDETTWDSMAVRITSNTVSDAGYSGAGRWSSTPVEQGVLTATSDQFFLDGALDADEHPSIDLRVDIPVEGPSSVGTFHFEFDVPVLDGIRMENIDQTVLANNVSMTLKTFVLHPSYTEALICFQMPSAVDWGLTASTVTIGGREYSFSGGGLIQGTNGKDFLLTDPERCSTIGFDIPYDESAASITLTVPKLVASVPEVVDKERVEAANQRLAATGIEFDYENIDHGGNIVVLKQPAGMTDGEIYPLIWDALAEQYEGPWVFTVPIER